MAGGSHWTGNIRTMNIDVLALLVPIKERNKGKDAQISGSMLAALSLEQARVSTQRMARNLT